MSATRTLAVSCSRHIQSGESWRRAIGRNLAPTLLLTLLLSACGDDPPAPPPPSMEFGGLPISGSLADAHRAGFANCVPDNVNMRCRRDGVMFEDQGPFDAAVDLVGSDGSGGFDHLTLWHAEDQDALVSIVRELRENGWSECLTPNGNNWGGQAIYQRQGSPIFISMDMSYWSKRRLRVYPARRGNIPQCRS
jgi:hypothetical protein